MSPPHPLSALLLWADGQLAEHIYTGDNNTPSKGRAETAQVMAALTWAAEHGMPDFSWPQRHIALVDAYQKWPPSLLEWARSVIAGQPDSPQRTFCWNIVSAMLADPRSWAVQLGTSNLAFRKMVGL